MTPYAHNLLPWVIFNLAVGLMLALDLGLLHKKVRTPTYTEALRWSGLWILLSILFTVWIAYDQGIEWATLFLTGYVIEKSLSLDNIMVFAIVFQTLKIPIQYQHKVLFWGIIGALVLRVIMIWGGVFLLQEFHFFIYIFGAILIISGLKILLGSKKEMLLEETWSWHLLGKFLPIDKTLDGENFIVQKHGKKFATPLLVSLILIELSDVVFAIDSIPAILAVTQDPFIIYTSNVFAILGLRSLYFLLANAMEHLRFLKKGLAVILCYVGFKMLQFINISTICSLLVVLTVLGVSVLCSLVFKEENAI